MGISGLLPSLKSIQKPTELKKCSGQTLGVDAYGWLHRAACSCARELAQDQPTKKYISAFMHRIKMLRHFGVTPYLVFDGDYLPSKAATEESRARRRNEKKAHAIELLKAGRLDQAAQEFQKCVDITPEMASAVIQHLKRLNVAYVVAPYEADAQLVYLERQNLIHGILSDDSDLLVFGAKRLLTKLDQYGNCIEINRRDFSACRELSLTGWTDTEFRRMAILSGCDYLEGIPTVGLKRAHRVFRSCKSPERAIRVLLFEGKRVPDKYLAHFYQAELTFLHQWVFCPMKKEVVHLTKLDDPEMIHSMPYIGPHIETELATAIAEGDVNPITKKPIIIPLTPTKRRHSQSSVAQSRKPPTKTINSYFRGHRRIPMGEMDPNCFPAGLRNLTQFSEDDHEPRVFPLPRPYVEDLLQEQRSPARRRTTSALTPRSPQMRRRRTEPIGSLLTQMSDGPFSASDHGAATSPLATRPQGDPRNRSQKKVRLCDGAEAERSPKNSRFFPVAAPRNPQRARNEALLMSDDSVELALRDLPDIDGWGSADGGSSEKTIAIFDEKAVKLEATGKDASMLKEQNGIARKASQTAPSQKVPKAASQTASRRASLSSDKDVSQQSRPIQDSIDDLTGTVSLAVTNTIKAAEGDGSSELIIETTKDSHDPFAVFPAPIKPVDNSSKPSSLPSTQGSRVAPPSTTPSFPRLERFSFSQLSSTPSSTSSGYSGVFSTASTSTAPSTARSLLTRLQRLGARAVGASHSPGVRAGSRYPAGARPRSSLPLNPCFVPLPKVDLAEMEALNRPCGSEDQMVPEADDVDGESGAEQSAKKLDLSSFLCS